MVRITQTLSPKCKIYSKVMDLFRVNPSGSEVACQPQNEQRDTVVLLLFVMVVFRQRNVGSPRLSRKIMNDLQ